MRAELLGLVTFGNGRGKIALPAIRHAERKLRVEVRGVKQLNELKVYERALAQRMMFGN